MFLPITNFYCIFQSLGGNSSSAAATMSRFVLIWFDFLTADKTPVSHNIKPPDRWSEWHHRLQLWQSYGWCWTCTLSSKHYCRLNRPPPPCGTTKPAQEQPEECDTWSQNASDLNLIDIQLVSLLKDCSKAPAGDATLCRQNNLSDF